MSDHASDAPNKGKPSSDEYGFDETRDPIEASDSKQAKASGYGIYGYADQAGEELQNEPPAPATDNAHAAKGSKDEDIGSAQGGNKLTDSDQGAGFNQPMSEPQRSASQSTRPK